MDIEASSFLNDTSLAVELDWIHLTTHGIDNIDCYIGVKMILKVVLNSSIFSKKNQ